MGEVWLATDVPAGIEQRLAEAGLTTIVREVLRSTTAAAVQPHRRARGA